MRAPASVPGVLNPACTLEAPGKPQGKKESQASRQTKWMSITRVGPVGLYLQVFQMIPCAARVESPGHVGFALLSDSGSVE